VWGVGGRCGGICSGDTVDLRIAGETVTLCGRYLKLGCRRSLNYGIFQQAAMK
jgi:hypothetical protein